MDCAHPARLVPCSVLRRAVRVHRHCLQRLRARRTIPSGHHAGVKAYAAYGEAPVTDCPRELHDRYVGCDRRAAPRLWFDMRRPDPPLAAGGSWQSAVTRYSGRKRHSWRHGMGILAPAADERVETIAVTDDLLSVQREFHRACPPAPPHHSASRNLARKKRL
jgi:hypothetical protein